MTRLLAVVLAVVLAGLMFGSRLLSQSSQEMKAKTIAAEAREAAGSTGPGPGPDTAGAVPAPTDPAAVAALSAPVVVSESPGPAVAGDLGHGLTFARPKGGAETPGVVQLGCHGDPDVIDHPHRGSCNPYEGDTSCRTVLPVACFKSTGAAEPPAGPERSQPGWTHGQLAATQPLMGASITSEAEGSRVCSAELGPGWRMARFHDGGGWTLRGERGIGLASSTRYWVHIGDQRGNCWDSAR